MSQQTLKQKIEQALTANDARLALRVIKDLEASLQAGLDSEKEAAIKRVIANLRIVALKFSRDDDIAAMFEKYPVQAVTVPETVDIIGNIRGRLNEEVFVEDRNALRDKWKASLERSEYAYGVRDIKLGEQEVKPTIGNWIKLYVSEMGTGKVTNIKMARFFSQNNDVQSLPENVKSTLLQIFKIYEFLKLRSEDYEGFEGEDIFEDFNGNTYVVEDGEMYKLYEEKDYKELEEKARNNKLPFAQLIDLQVKFPERFGKYVYKTDLKIQDILTPERVEQRSRAFFEEQKIKYTKNIQANQLPKYIQEMLKPFLSCLQTISDKNIVYTKQVLQIVVKDTNSLKEFLSLEPIQELIISEFPESLGKTNLDLIKQNPLHPIAIQALLIIIYKDKFQLSDEEALWHAFEIVRNFPIAFKDFKTIVTYDVVQNKLVWKY